MTQTPDLSCSNHSSGLVRFRQQFRSKLGQDCSSVWYWSVLLAWNGPDCSLGSVLSEPLAVCHHGGGVDDDFRSSRDWWSEVDPPQSCAPTTSLSSHTHAHAVTERFLQQEV